MSVKDTFSKYAWLFPLTDQEAIPIFQILRFLCEKEGFPEIFQSDNGKEFVARIIKMFLKKHNVKIKHGKPYHPQSQGQVENLNKTVKNHLNRIIQTLPKKEAANTWPMYLPGIASTINKTWHTTIDDTPFRVYHNRHDNSQQSHFVPDDQTFMEMEIEDDQDYEDSEDETDDDDDNTDDEEDLDLTERIPNSMTKEEIIQSCASASLSSQVFQTEDSNDIDDAVDGVDANGDGIYVEEEKFTNQTFNTALYSLSKESQFVILQALEATEYGVHRNIKRARKKVKEDQRFKIGDKVLIKNPKHDYGRHKRTYFEEPRNVIAIITDVLPNCMYRVKVGVLKIIN